MRRMTQTWIAVAMLLCVASTLHAQTAACEAPVFEVDIFTAELSPDGTSSIVLSFDDPNPAGDVTGYNIYRSSNPAPALGSWTMLSSGIADQNAAQPGIQWTESSAGFPATGIWFYLATPFNEPCGVEGPWKSLRVNNTADFVDLIPGDGACWSEGGGCTLRAAVQEANALGGLETIVLGDAGYALTLEDTGAEGSADGDLDLTAPVILRGLGSVNTLIDAQGLDRVLHVWPGVVARVEGLTLQGGRSGRGGGLLVESMAQATLRGVAVNDNHSLGDGGGIALDVEAQLTLEHSTLSHNLADGSGGGLMADGFATIENSTLGWNAAGGIDDGSGAEGIGAADGGAICVGTDGAVSLVHATLSDNRATLGGALANAGAVEMRNTVVTDSFEGGNCDGPVDSLGHNLSSDFSCDLTAPGDLQDVDPLLGPLQVYGGGGTGTYPPLEDSPVIEAGEDCLAVDQVFAERRFCCIGAAEVNPTFHILPSGLVYVGDHPWQLNTAGDHVSIIGAATNVAGGYLTIPDVEQIKAHPNSRKLYMLQSVNHTTPVPQNGLIAYDAAYNTATGLFFGNDLRDIAVRPSGARVVVTDATTDEARIFNTTTNLEVAAIPFQSEPQGIAIHPQGWKAYVTLLSANKVKVVRLDTLQVIGEFTSGPQPVDAVFHPAGHRAYVLNHYGVSVTVIDGLDQVITTIDLGAPLGTGYDYFGSIAIHPSGDYVYVADGQLTGGIAVISTATNQVVDTIITAARRVAVHPLGARVYLADCEGATGFKVISVPGHSILSQQTLRGSPCGIAVLP
jgi:hypothetical protein